MRIADCTFSLIFQPIPEIRRSVFDIEDRLDGYVKPFQVYPIPDEAPFELPRISTTTESGHSTLTIAAQNAQVQTIFDDNYSSDFGKSLNYSKEKAVNLQGAFSNMSGFAIEYAGLSAQLVVPSDEFGAHPVDFIKDKYLTVDSNLALSDAAAKLVYNVEEDYYLNLEVRKAIFSDPVSINVGPDGIAITTKVTPHEDQLVVVVDFNNRLAFNNGRRLGCNSGTIEVLYQKVLDFASCGIEAFLKDGEVKF